MKNNQEVQDNNVEKEGQHKKHKMTIHKGDLVPMVLIILVILVFADMEISRIKHSGDIKVLHTSDDSTYENNEIFISAMFPSDGKLYKPKYDDIIFYSDPECNKKIKNVKLISKDIGYLPDSDIYCYRMNNGEICYSRQQLSWENFEECD